MSAIHDRSIKNAKIALAGKFSWKGGLYVDLDRELWPYADLIIVHYWAYPSDWRFNINQRYAHEIDAKTGLFYGLNRLALIIGRVDYEVISLRTKGGVVLQDVEDIKEFLLK